MENQCVADELSLAECSPQHSERPLRLIYIVNNFGESFDGVGAYGKEIYQSFPKYIEARVFGGYCDPRSSSFVKVINFGMMGAIDSTMCIAAHEPFDAVLMEYPFAEWNPAILMKAHALYTMIKSRGIKFFLSVHEYKRTSRLRQLVTKHLCKMADTLFVSSDAMGHELSGYCRSYFVRNIPSNIQIDFDSDHSKKDKRSYVFFGLLHKAKAFDEMLAGWDAFNDDGSRTLYVISASRLGDIESNHRGIRYIFNANDDEISRIMTKCCACVLPIVPLVDYKSATFKTACLAGCISMGVFDDEYSSLDFIMPMNDYSVESFKRTFAKVEAIPEEKRKLISKLAVDFGSKYTAKAVAEMMAEKMYEICFER